jgi:putative membrane protein
MVLLTIGLGFAAVASLLHGFFFYLESMSFTNPSTWKRFGVASQADADVLKPMAYNQGFYNLFLAVGSIIGIVLVAAGNTAVGAALVIFGTASMALAGVVLLSTGRERIRAAAIQFLPAVLAVLFTALGLATR